MYGRSGLVMVGLRPDYPIVAVTNPIVWDPFTTDPVFASDLSIQTAVYTSGTEFWLTESGVTGWLGYGEKDVYRISKTITGAKAVRVRTLQAAANTWCPSCAWARSPIRRSCLKSAPIRPPTTTCLRASRTSSCSTTQAISALCTAIPSSTSLNWNGSYPRNRMAEHTRTKMNSCWIAHV